MKIEIYSPTIRRKEMDAVLTAMVEEKIGPGDRNRLLIQTAKEHLHYEYALALRSSAFALHFALKALDVKQGQAVVISALSPRYYLQVLNDLHITPVYCDVTYDFPCMNKELIENAIAKKCAGLEVAAVILHHTLGFMPDTAGIIELGFPIIEDISQSYGSWIKPSEKTGDNKKGESSFSQFTILGLEERDMLTSGGGALLFATNKKDASVLRSFTGIADEYCLTDINSALAIVQFKEMSHNLKKRYDIAEIFIQASMRTRHKRFIPKSDDYYCYYSFSLVLETGLKDVIAYAKKKDIILENAFGNTIAGSGIIENCPVSNSLCLRTVLFPLYPRLRSKDVERISRLIMTLP
ncbi:MAG: DegT/DnrJ/EryC1/StrS family aminotransferase [Treponema sp.]|jgi:dTDP-4-amino-4,6-dideoxygalactose transaminase|nr:DegT/DnrJ/EryC1/StrS family aminotransferase [Treponema sp.]